MNKRPTPADNLIANLIMLLDVTGMKKTELAKKSGIGKRTVYCILNRERGASIQMAADLAGAFGLNGWDIIKPELNYDLAKSGKLDELIEQYSKSTEGGRKTIDSVAENAPKFGHNGN